MQNGVKHIAFIPDGNRRFAKEMGISSLEGHRKGYERFKDVVKWCKELGVHEVTFWGFSTENWKRSKEEVGYLMDLFVRMLTNDLKYLVEEGTHLRMIGRRSDLPENVVKAIERAEEQTCHLSTRFVNILFNYGGRSEITDAVRRALAEGVILDDLTEEKVDSLMWSHGMTEPDLVIRTSGEQRLSGLLPWKAAYAELYFSPKYWPAFTREDLEESMRWYVGRERRFGGDGGSK